MGSVVLFCNLETNSYGEDESKHETQRIKIHGGYRRTLISHLPPGAQRLRVWLIPLLLLVPLWANAQPNPHEPTAGLAPNSGVDSNSNPEAFKNSIFPSIEFKGGSDRAPEALSEGGGALTWNFENGAGEVDFWNLYSGARESFDFYQKQADGGQSRIASFSTHGLLLGGKHINSSSGQISTGSRLQIEPPAILFKSSVSPVFSVSARVAGSLTSGNTQLNKIVTLEDQVNTTGPGGPDELDYLYVQGSFGGGNFSGMRTGIKSYLAQVAPDTHNPGGATYYTSGAFWSLSSVNNGGVRGGPYSGNLFGVNAVCVLNPGATFWNEQVCDEVDSSVTSGASVAYKEGLKIVELADDAGAGIIEDFALGFNNQPGTSPGWRNLIQIGSNDGIWPLQRMGAIMTTQSTRQRGRPYAAAHGIDLSGVKFSMDAFRSQGFVVNGDGDVAASTVTLHLFRVRALPKCDAARKGQFAAVWDASAPTYNGPLVGGGTESIPVFCNGSRWTAH